MKYLKRYENHEDIDAICQRYGIKNYSINSDGYIDVNSDISLTLHRELTKLPLKFGNISGHFDCYNNSLTTLIDCPTSVGGDFFCYQNRLTSLIYCPKLIYRNLSCKHNNIDTFEGLDFIHIGGEFYCGDNPIWSIWDLFRDHTKFEFFNDCDIIREDRVIILERLNFFLDYIGKRTVTEVEGYKCI
jgi:hypothetical protein